jgi:hypothetical protein
VANNTKKLKIERRECVNVILVYLILDTLLQRFKRPLKSTNKKKDQKYYGDLSNKLYNIKLDMLQKIME